MYYEKLTQYLLYSYKPDKLKIRAIQDTKDKVEILIDGQNNWVKNFIEEEIKRITTTYENHHNGCFGDNRYCSNSSFDRNSFNLYDWKITLKVNINHCSLTV